MSKKYLAFAALSAMFVGAYGLAAHAEEPQAPPAVGIDFTVNLEEEVEGELVDEMPVVKKAGAAVMLQQLVAPLFGPGAVKEDPKAIEAQIKQWMPQFKQQYRPILWTELNFIRLTCDLTPEQRLVVKAAGDTTLKEIVRRMAEMQVRPQAPGRVQVEPRKAIRKALSEALAKTLPAEAMQKYQSELDQRAERRKQATILSVLARMDNTLYLTEEQRTAIEKSLTSGWQDDWEQWLFMHIYGDQYFPTVPDQHVVGHLNPDQKTVWKTLQKVNFGYWGAGGQADDAAWWGDKPDPDDQPEGAAIFGGVIMEQE